MHPAEFLSVFFHGGRGARQPRVFWPGDELPVGVTVMGRDGSVGQVKFPGTKVQESQSDPVIEVLLPRFEHVVQQSYARNKARREISGNLSNLP